MQTAVSINVHVQYNWWHLVIIWLMKHSMLNVHYNRWVEVLIWELKCSTLYTTGDTDRWWCPVFLPHRSSGLLLAHLIQIRLYYTNTLSSLLVLVNLWICAIQSYTDDSTSCYLEMPGQEAMRRLSVTMLSFFRTFQLANISTTSLDYTYINFCFFALCRQHSQQLCLHSHLGAGGGLPYPNWCWHIFYDTL